MFKKGAKIEIYSKKKEDKRKEKKGGQKQDREGGANIQREILSSRFISGTPEYPPRTPQHPQRGRRRRNRMPQLFQLQLQHLQPLPKPRHPSHQLLLPTLTLSFPSSLSNPLKRTKPNKLRPLLPPTVGFPSPIVCKSNSLGKSSDFIFLLQPVGVWVFQFLFKQPCCAYGVFVNWQTQTFYHSQKREGSRTDGPMGYFGSYLLILGFTLLIMCFRQC